MSGSTIVSRQEKYFYIVIETPIMIFDAEDAMAESQWHEGEHKALTSKINKYAPKIKAEIDSIIKNDNDKFGIIEYSSDIKLAPYNIDDIVANANRPYRIHIRNFGKKYDLGSISDNEDDGFKLLISFDDDEEIVYLDDTEDASGDDVLFTPAVTGPYRYTFKLSPDNFIGYTPDVTVALKLAIPASARKELATRLLNSIR